MGIVIIGMYYMVMVVVYFVLDVWCGVVNGVDVLWFVMIVVLFMMVMLVVMLFVCCFDVCIIFLCGMIDMFEWFVWV